MQIETIFMRQTIGQQPQALGKGGMVALYVINTLNNMDLTANNVEVMVGGENGQPEQLLPGAVSSLIYASDLENVYARAANPSPVVLAFGSNTSVRGTYTFRGLHNGRPFYNLDGEADDPVVSSISFNGAFWKVYNAAGAVIYTSLDAPAIPSLADWSGTGQAEVLTNTVLAPGPVTAGNVNVIVHAAGFNSGAPLIVPVAIANADTDADIASKAAIALNLNATFAAFFTASSVGADLIVTFDAIAANDTTAGFAVVETTAGGVTPTESTITAPGIVDAELTTIDGVDITLKVFRKTQIN